MNNQEAAAIIRIEQACVLRQDTPDCHRYEHEGCLKCDLSAKTEDVLEAYDMALAALMKQNYKECPVCGKAYAYTNVCPVCNAELR